VEKHIPEMKSRISTVVSPMVASAKWIKEEDPEALVTFIGPCFSKKGEAIREGQSVDFVITFEELSSMVIGCGVNLAEISLESEHNTAASCDGNAFACAGSVVTAVKNTLNSLYPEITANTKHCEGIGECLKELKNMRDGKSATTLLEGMACTGGCIGGPGTLLDFRVTRKQVEKYSQTSKTKYSFENVSLLEKMENSRVIWHNKRTD
jgi:iron only hydrogenase large subunit-like protein